MFKYLTTMGILNWAYHFSKVDFRSLETVMMLLKDSCF